jgi:hypothetical protein
MHPVAALALTRRRQGLVRIWPWKLRLSKQATAGRFFQTELDNYLEQ